MAISHRPAFTQAHPELQPQHRAAQSAMFAAANSAHLPTRGTARDAMLDGINAALNRQGARRLISRTQLRIDEMNAITLAIESGFFGPNWEWPHAWFLFIESLQITRSVRIVSVFPEPRDGERARAIVARHNIMHTVRARAIRPTAISPLGR